MNLRAIANSITRGVNPNNTQAVLMTNMGYQIMAGGKQVAIHDSAPIEIQTQSIESDELDHLNLVSQQGQYSFVYANGLISAQRRSLGKGEDYLVFKPYGEDQNTIWKVTKVMESYPDWVKVLVVRMNQVDIDKLQFFGFSESGFAKPFDVGVFLK